MGEPAAGAVVRVDARAIDRLVAQMDEANVLGGQVYVSVGGQPLADRAFGYADAARTELLSEDHRLPAACASKVLDGIAFVRLVEAQRIEPDDPLVRWWPQLGPAPAGRVTVGSLPTHCAGFTSDPCMENPLAPWDERTLAALAAVGSSEAEPVRYTLLSAYQLLAEVMATATGSTYEELMWTEVLDPASASGIDLRLGEGPLRRPAFTRTTSGGHAPMASTEWPQFHGPIWPGASCTLSVRSLARVYELILEDGAGASHLLSTTGVARLTGAARAEAYDPEIRSTCSWGTGVARADSELLGRRAGEDAFGHIGLGGIGVYAEPGNDLVVGFAANCQLTRDELTSALDAIRAAIDLPGG